MKRRTALFGICIAGLFAEGVAAARAEAALQPYQMVRSLQLVQDRIADGDHAAVPMQKKLLEMIDKRLLDATSEELAEERNLRAVLVYGMSGGNPKTVEATLVRLKLEGTHKALSVGVVNYLRGRPTAVQSALASADAVALAPELGAFVALIKGSVAADADPAAALALLDQARLLGPGTLVEEAALRRSVSLATILADPVRFLRLSSLYARRYLRSPYASQFADAFVAGVVALDGKLALDAVDEITGWMTGEQRQVVYLRIARRAAIDGLKPLAEFASAKAREGSGAGDARALLYSMLGTVTSETVDEARLKIAQIDRAALSESDLELLDAVNAVAEGLTPALPTLDGPIPARPARPEPATRRPASSVAPAPAAAASPQIADPEQLPAQADVARPAPSGEQPELAADQPPAEPPAAAAPTPANAGEAQPASAQDAIGSESAAHQAAGGTPDPTEEVVKIARAKLDEVDKLLKDTAR